MRDNQQFTGNQSCHLGLICGAFAIGTTLFLAGVNTLGAVIGGELAKMTNTTWGGPVSEKRILNATAIGSSIGFFSLTFCFTAYIACYLERRTELQNKLAQWFHATVSIDAAGGAFLFSALANFIFNKISKNEGSLPQSSFIGCVAWAGSLMLLIFGYILYASAQCALRCISSDNAKSQPIEPIPQPMELIPQPTHPTRHSPMELTEVVAFQPEEKKPQEKKLIKPMEIIETAPPFSSNTRVFQTRHRRQQSSIGGESSAANPFKHQRQFSC